MKKLIFLLCIMATLSLTSCGGSFEDWKYRYCTDCTQEPLVRLGAIQEFTGGVYVKTACFTIDLSKILTSSGSLAVGDILYIEYEIKQGEFCAPDDRSTYKIYTIHEGHDSGEEPVMIVPADAILKTF